MAVKVMRVFCGAGRYKYHTAIGDFDVHGETGRWKVYRGGKVIADMELLGEVDFLISTVVNQTMANRLKKAQ